MYTTAIADPDYFTSKQGVIDLAEFSQNTDNLNITAVQEVLKRLQSRCIRHSALTISRTVYSVLGENSSLKERQELTDIVMALDLTIEPHECSKSADNTSSLLKSGRRVKVRAPKHNYRTRKPFIPTPMSDSEQSLSPNKRNYDKYMIKKQRKASEKYARKIGKKMMSSHHCGDPTTIGLSKSAIYWEYNSTSLRLEDNYFNQC